MNTTVYMSYLMIGVLLLVAIACLIAPAAELWLPGNRKYAMAGVLVVYSGVRFYRIRRWIKLNSHDIHQS